LLAETHCVKYTTDTVPRRDLTRVGHTQDHDQEHPKDAQWTRASTTQTTYSN